MLLVNLCGAPGAGKSTGAAYIFSKLKMKGVNAELVTEYAKDKVWEEATEVFNNQLYIFGKQCFRLSRLENKVDVVVTDSPVLLSIIYNTDNARLGTEFNSVVVKVAKSFPERLNYFVNRVKPYSLIGRFQTETQSDNLCHAIRNVFINNDERLFEIEGNIKGYDSIVTDVCEWLGV